MSGWIRVDNGFGGHHKTLMLPDEQYLAGVGLYVLGICYSDAHTTDGFIPFKAVPRIAADGYEDVVVALLEVGLWYDAPGGYRIHDYLDWQRSGNQIKAASDAGRKAANTRWGITDSNTDGNANGNTDGNADNTREEKRRRENIKDKTKGVSFSTDGIPEDIFGYWLNLVGRDAVPDDIRSLKTIFTKYGGQALKTAIGQANVQRERVDNYGLITVIAKAERG